MYQNDHKNKLYLFIYNIAYLYEIIFNWILKHA
jgi:hypothetical protein